LPYISGDMIAYPVSTRVNSQKFDDPPASKPLSNPPALF
jgi:hypothetical protein